MIPQVAAFLFLLLAHYFTGKGILSLFGIQLKRIMHIALSCIVGVAVLSMIPVLLQAFFIPITFGSLLLGIIIITLLLNIRTLKNWKKWKKISWNLIPTFRVYEWPFMILFAIIMFASIWRTFYYPPVARDMLSGPEAIAEYTLKEHTLINSVFSVNLETTNNQHKPPYVLGLQVIYKFFGFPFGQLWLSIISISFLVFLYQMLREKLHPLLACCCMLFFLAIPELYAYTYIILFDYSNMIFYFLGFYFLWQYFQTHLQKEFYFSAFLLGLATYIRADTLIFMGLLLPLLLFHDWKTGVGFKKLAIHAACFLGFSFFFYFIWVEVFLRFYIPGFDLGEQINPNLLDFSPFIERFKGVHTTILFGKYGMPLWAHYMQVFLVFMAAEIIVFRKLSRETRNWLYGIAIIYVGLPLMGYLLPLADLNNTTKRGFFKMLPLMLMVMANSELLKRLSTLITNWESGSTPEVATVGKSNHKPKSKRK
jgi:hypothetical protein